MRIGLLCSSPVVYGAMGYLFESGYLAGVAAPSDKPDFVAQLEGFSSKYHFTFHAIDLANLESSLLDWLHAIQADVVFVFTFPKRIPSTLLSIPASHGFINFHGGKLPEYRSPVPDFWMIRNGEKQGMVTAHIMEAEFDAGPVLFEAKVNITENETSGTLIAKMGQVLGYCMERTIEELEKGNPGLPQDTSLSRYYRRPGEQDLVCDFYSMDAREIHALVRATIPRFKGAFTKIAGHPVRIIQTTLSPQKEQYPASTGVIAIDRIKQEIWIGCARQTSIRIDVVDLYEGVFSGYRFAEYIGLRQGEIV